jgi:hypothetical protein
MMFLLHVNGKIQTTRLLKPAYPIARDGSPGLFIGTNKLLFALMNSAPAELLHPLIHAALQPLRSPSLFGFTVFH